RRRDVGVGGGEECLVLEIALAVELRERCAAGGKEGRRGTVGADEAERTGCAAAPRGLELHGRVRGRRGGPGERRPRGGGAGDGAAILRRRGEVAGVRIGECRGDIGVELEVLGGAGGRAPGPAAV